MNKKKTLSIPAQIKHMKEKGISFNTIENKEAEEFLQSHNYYFRVRCYAKNYLKADNKYINLDFLHLKELSIVDYYLRRTLLKMTLDIEHRLKVNLLERLLILEKIDAYPIVASFLQDNEKINSSIKKQLNQYQNSIKQNKIPTSYNANLMLKYYPDFPIWVLTELVSFGDFIQLYKFCYKEIQKKPPYQTLLWSTKIIRNACAHNSCLLNNLSSTIKPITSKQIDLFLNKNKELKPYYDKYKENYVIIDIITVCYLYNKLAINSFEKQNTFKELQNIINRVLESHIFKDNELIFENFELLNKVINKFI